MKHDLRQARYERARWWLERGVAVVPLKPQSKELQPGYGSRLARITDTKFAREWFLNTDANLGVVLGGLAGLIVGDWDNAPDYESWQARVGVTAETLTEQTARGYHAFFWGHHLPPAMGQGCELKTRGVCVAAPSVHPFGGVYHVVKDVPIARIEGETAHLLFPFLSKAPGEEEQKDGLGSLVIHKLRKKHADARVDGNVVTCIKAARSIVDEMSLAGVKLQCGGKTTLVGLCPFHSDQSPSLWVNPESGLWGCNRPDCPAAGTHDVINFRAMHRGVSNGAAIRQLAAEFLKPDKR